jgi:hypothetical protein
MGYTFRHCGRATTQNKPYAPTTAFITFIGVSGVHVGDLLLAVNGAPYTGDSSPNRSPRASDGTGFLILQHRFFEIGPLPFGGRLPRTLGVGFF